MSVQNLLKRFSRPEIVKFIEENRHFSTAEIILKYSSNKELPVKEIAEQIECLKKAKKKLPELNKHTLLYKKVSLEQASSELTAGYKLQKLKGKRIIDLTGGLGIDSIYFSKSFDEVIYCEINEELAEIAGHNFKTLGIKNVNVRNGDGIKILNEYTDN